MQNLYNHQNKNTHLAKKMKIAQSSSIFYFAAKVKTHANWAVNKKKTHITLSTIKSKNIEKIVQIKYFGFEIKQNT